MKRALLLLCVLFLPLFGDARVVRFMGNPDKHLKPFYNRSDVIMITSPGRSGSSLLFSVLDSYAPSYDILKTHMFPPNPQFKGKILFVFCNPDKAAESALHKTLESNSWGSDHFHHVQSSNKKWLKKITTTSRQTVQYNLLAQDALGSTKQLIAWLKETIPSTPDQAQILAIKYENLWDIETINAIQEFLRLDHFEIPPHKERGYTLQELHPKERLFRQIYNIGTPESPIYSAYNDARSLWESAPPLQYLNLR
jgi:hypothetical protein